MQSLSILAAFYRKISVGGWTIWIERIKNSVFVIVVSGHKNKNIVCFYRVEKISVHMKIV